MSARRSAAQASRAAKAIARLYPARVDPMVALRAE